MTSARTLWRGPWVIFALAAALVAAGSEAATGTNTSAPSAERAIRRAVDSPVRSAQNRARDRYRHPVETLMFFGVRPDMTVVELWPFGGWYTEILAPLLKEHGKLYAAAMDPASTDAEDRAYNRELHTLFDAHPQVFGSVTVTVLAPGNMHIAPDGSADMVLTFRNIHNWVWDGVAKDVFAAAFRALKPGGVLGVVEHRSNDPQHAPKSGEGYVGEQYAIELIQSVGFRLAGRSDINRNPRDTKDYPRGVWALPPTYANGDQDRAKYAAIGESDRFTLRFVKPAAGP
jgi:predicted methyltransferase